MEDVVGAVVLGIVEGITEFLPISSTGHLLIAEHWLGRRSDLFNIAIQSGAILAVVLIYRERLWDFVTRYREAEVRDYILQLALALLITTIGGLAVKQFGFELPTRVAPVAWALVIGGLLILAIERHAAHLPETSRMTLSIAAWVGAAQILAAVFPGTSRSAATIFAAMLAGCTSRAAATEFAFLLGIPTMFGATAYALLEALAANETEHEPWGELFVAFVVSAVVAFIAVKWLLAYIRTHRFTVFAWYRIAFGVALLFLI